MSPAAAEVKSCCAAVYGSEAIRWLLGDRLHPGGARLTDELVDALGIGAGALVADVGCGAGSSALQAAVRTGCDVVGIDLSPDNVRAARAAAARAGLDGRARFEVGDAERLPLADATLDGVLCECALCTFPDKRAAASEIARVLRPGGVLALSDMTADRARIPDALRTLDARIACIGDARSLDELEALLTSSGLTVEHRERRDDALAALVDRAESRLRFARAAGATMPAALAGAVERGLAIAAAAREAIAETALGYAVLIARRA